MSMMLALYKGALHIAAEDMYHSEVVEMEMEDSVIGEWRDYADKEDWIESRMEEWISRGKAGFDFDRWF